MNQQTINQKTKNMTKVVTGAKEFFKGIEQIQFEGLTSDNPLERAF
jgi:hypothetical protein